jgi:hypothetical protein
MEKDHSMYIYFDGIGKYPNKKAAFFGFYEQSFENTYKGTKDDKAEKFMDYMLELLYEQCSDGCHFGSPDVDEDKCLEDYIRKYKEPDYRLDIWK